MILYSSATLLKCGTTVLCGQADLEDGALGDIVFCGDAAFVLPHYFIGEVQAKAGAFGAAAFFVAYAVKFVEDLFLLPIGYARPMVFYL